MGLRYICRYCRQELGCLPSDHFAEQALGFHFLTTDERNDIIQKNFQGETLVRVTCENCQQALEEHPELGVEGNLLQ